MKISKLLLLTLESMIPIGLLWISWRLFEIYSLSISVLLLVLYLLFAPYHIKILKKANVAKAMRLKLVFLTGSSIIICLSILFYTSKSLINIYRIGFVTKEAVEVDRRQLVDIGCLGDECRISRLKSECFYSAILLMSFCIIYSNRLKTDILLNNPSDVKEN